MNRRCCVYLSSLIVGVGLVGSAAAAGQADQLDIIDPYVRLAPPNAPATGAFMRLKNTGHTPIRLVKASNPNSKATELHDHIHDQGVMKMRQIPEIVIPAQGEVVLKPGGLHVMLIGMRAPLKEGDQVPIRLECEEGSSKEIQAPVRRIQVTPMTH